MKVLLKDACAFVDLFRDLNVGNAPNLMVAREPP